MENLISIDEENRIRAMPAEQYKESDELVKTAVTFGEKVVEFEKLLESLNDVLTTQTSSVENTKLRAIGYRMKTEMEPEELKKSTYQLQRLMKEKEAELRRLEIQLESLEKIEKDQLTTIEKLSRNDGV